MADDRKNQPGPQRGPDTSRKPVTIDLAADAVKPASATASAAPKSDGIAPGGSRTAGAATVGTSGLQAEKPDLAPDAARIGATITVDRPTGASGAASTKPGGKPGAASPKPATGKDASSNPIIPSAFAPGTKSAGHAESAAAPASAGRRGTTFASLLLAAVLGGLVVEAGDLAAGRLGWSAPSGSDDTALRGDVSALRTDLAATTAKVGALGQPTPSPAADLAALRGDLATLQGTVADLGNRAAAPADTTAFDDVQRRVAALEQAPQPTAGATTADPAVDALTTQVTDLAARLAAIEARPVPDLAGLETGLASLRAGLADLGGHVDTANAAERLSALEPKVAAAEASATATHGLAEAIAADALGSAVAGGRPFAAELTALKSLGVDDPAFADLSGRAETGLAGDAALVAEFRALSEGLRTNAPVPATAGPVDRLLQSARGLVQIRPAGPAAGSDPGSVMARIVDRTGRGELAPALADWDALPDAAKSATAEWAGKLRARLAAETLAERLRAAALARLAGPG